MENLETQLEKLSATDERLIRRYLFDELSAKEEEMLGARLLSEPDWEKAISLIEEEMLADYAAGRLNPNERTAVERVYLKNPSAKRELQFAQALHRAGQKYQINEKSKTTAANVQTTPGAAEAKQPLAFWRNLFAWQPHYIYGATLILVLAAAGLAAIWFLTGNERASIESEIARLNQSAGLPPSADVVLNSQNLRGGVTELQRLQISKEQSAIRFRLNLTGNPADGYRAVFLDAAGAEMFAVSSLASQVSADGNAVVFFVPARLFRRGDYQISLQSRKEREAFAEAGRYGFRVL